MDELLTKGLTYILAALINIAVGYVIVFLRKHKVIKELEAHKELVNIAVVAIQQAYETLDGNEKFELAKDWIVSMANSKGLKITDKEIEFLIDSAVKELKVEFGDEWKKVVN
ncbi:phage holin [Cytobacillus praedii]|uniref:Phage holin n=1 Tax=Cytobacillus praedii TaxID=1742358 RepID=A0A4R1ATP8_9BACI|nr:phage holin [Cytobacillus praedii]TCJ01605.1 phage holin [Cytobacillus praedii]